MGSDNGPTVITMLIEEVTMQPTINERKGLFIQAENDDSFVTGPVTVLDLPYIFLRVLPPAANLRQLRSRRCERDGRLLLLPSPSRTTLLCFGNDIKAGCGRGARILPECYRGPRRIAFRCGGR